MDALNTPAPTPLATQPGHQQFGSLRIAMQLLSRNPAQSAAIVALLVLCGVLESIGIVAVTPLFENLQSLGTGGPQQPGHFARWLGFQPSSWQIAVFVLTVFSVKSAVRFVALDWIISITTAISHTMRTRISAAVARARWSYFTDQSVGRFIDTYTVQTQVAGNTFTAACRVIAEAAQGLTYIVATAFISWKLALAAPLLIGGTLYLFRSLMERIKSSGVERVRHAKALAGRTADGLHGFKPLKSMGQEHLLVQELDEMSRRLAAEDRRQASTVVLLNNLQEPVMIALLIVSVGLAMGLTSTPLPELLVLGLLGYRALGRVGTLQSAYAAFIASVVVYRSLSETVADIERQADVMTGTVVSTFATSIELRGVSFDYPGRCVLSNVDLVIPAGAFVAIEGGSGSGKTTLVDLMLGLNRPTTGQVLLDGVQLEDVDIAAWRRMVGYVTQDAALLHATILENVSMRDPSVGREQVIEALNAAGLATFVANLPDGIDTSVGERGAKISGGQRQRIAIARALVRHPRILILDEATSALDPASQLQIKSTIEQLAGKLTIIVISHQRNFVESADIRCTVADGEVVVSMKSATRSAAQ
jgi:ATP-binding cassette subfamily C protein